MRKLGILVVGVAWLLAMSGSATATTDCDDYGAGSALSVGGGDGRTDDAWAHVCVNTDSVVDGGYAEVGQGDGNGDNGGVYAVADGSDSNPGGTVPVAGRGYVGLSNYESGEGGSDSDCDGIAEDASDTNSGGCLYIKPTGITVPVPLLACSMDPIANDWANTPEDGCRTFWPDS